MAELQTAREPGNAPGAESSRRVECLLGRYTLLRRLGRGGMGSVFLAWDSHRERQVALKRVRRDRLGDTTLETVRNEFLLLASLHHPHLARVFDFGLDPSGQDVFFTSEFVEGVDWRGRKTGQDLSAPADLAAFLETTVQVLRALEFIHYHKLVHGDIKPENILITGTSAAGRGRPGAALAAKLIDFGVTKREKECGGRLIMGSVSYMAPETIVGARVDRRTDLYSLGIVLYHLATGQLPFRGDHQLAVFKGHLEGRATPPRELVPGLPEALSKLILRLIEKRPVDRFQSALEVIDHVNRELGCSFPLETDETLEAYLDGLDVSGQARTLERLATCFAFVARTPPLDAALLSPSVPPASGRQGARRETIVPPRGHLVLLRGEKGIGKRGVLERLRQVVQTQGAVVVDVRCGASAANPWLDFERLLGELRTGFRAGGDLRFLEPAKEALRLRRTGTGEEEPPKAALEELAGGVVARCHDQPVLILLRDLHRGSGPVLGFVERLVERLQLEQGPKRLLVVASALDQPDVEGSRFEALCEEGGFRRAIAEVKLQRLERHQVEGLVHSLLWPNDFSSALIGRVYDESDGNPEAIREILAFLLRGRRIVRTTTGWILRPGFEREAIPGRLRREMEARIDALSPGALRLAMAFACLGDETELELAARFAFSAPENVEEHLRPLLEARLIQERVQGDPRGVYSFIHPSAREMLYGRLPRDKRSDLHERAGRLSEEYYGARGEPRPEKLAHHYLRSGNREKAILYGLAAASELVRRARHPRALEIYDDLLALAGPEGAARAIRLEAARLRLEVGDFRGALDTVAALCRDEPGEIPERDQARAYLIAARALAPLGCFEEATASARRALESAEREEGNRAELLAQGFLALAELCALKGEAIECLRCSERAGRIDGGLSDPRDRARLSFLQAETHHLLGNQEAALFHSAAALRVAEESGAPQASLFFLGKHYEHQGHWRLAIREFQAALAASRRHGLVELESHCHLAIGKLNLLLDRAGAAVPELQRAHALFARACMSPRSLEALSLLAEALRLTGDVEECRKCLVRAQSGAEALKNPDEKTRVLLSSAALCLDGGDLENAERYLFEAGVRTAVGSPAWLPAVEVRFLLALARGELGAALAAAGEVLGEEGEEPARRSRLLAARALLQCRLGMRAEARRAGVALLGTARRQDFPLAEGRARMIEAVIAGQEGKPGLAERGFLQAERVFREEGAERDLAELELELGGFRTGQGNLEDAYLRLEEGFYLTKRLHVEYLKCRAYYLLGCHEARMGGGSRERAEERLRAALGLARRAGFVELLAQVAARLGVLLEGSGREAEGVPLRAEAEALRQRVVSGLSAVARASYLEGAAREEAAWRESGSGRRAPLGP